ncbi:hypothetical protein BDY19DRAFT_1046901 [Irpex rosettiformis]|uniref:Uncharacterized protein n=1 Tax=Irpex rosettiformis TaxID=378272 RepID=A0ACB8UAB2_9APHY|nr:hypothetical protein BDY19DRAFT_1046901 [Irpex rosettiformis]
MYSIAVRNALRRAAVAPVSRTLIVGKRFTSTVNENDPEVIDLEKQRNLRGEQHETSTPIKNAPGWNEYLASASEAAVKADRSELNLNPEQLAAETVHHIKDRHHSQVVNGEERLDAYEASYERDDLDGPLNASRKKNFKYQKTVSKKESDLSGGI